jgi:hypothetical protein
MIVLFAVLLFRYDAWLTLAGVAVVSLNILAPALRLAPAR